MKRTRIALTTTVVALALALSAAAQPPIEMTLIPPVQTQIGEMTRFLIADFNDKGQVAGRASGPGLGGIAAARYSPGRGVEDLDPNGKYRSEAVAINAKGEILGFVFGGEVLYEDAFVHSPRSGFDRLEKGKSRKILDGFIPGFPGGGVLSRSRSFVGGDLGIHPGDPSLRPIAYTKRGGWVDVSGVHPRFADEPTLGAYVGDRGHQVFMISAQGERRQDLFMRLPKGEVVELVSPGAPFMSASRPNKKGRMAGVWESDGGASRAFVFTAATGVVDIHPEGFKASYATDMSDKGAAVGVLKPDTRFSDVFVHTDQAGLEIVATGDDFEELANGRKGSFNGVRPERINNKGEIVGCVYMRKGPDFPFYYSDRHGLVDLAAAVAEANPAVEAADCSPHLNNRGQILLGVKEGSRITGAILRVAG